MKKLLKNKKALIIGAIVLLVAIIGVIVMTRDKSVEIIEPPSKKPKKQVNLIPQDERPYVTLQPLSSRNSIEFTIHDLKKDAKSVELTLEYDRNEGVLDAVLYTFDIKSVPFTSTAFLGSKSAGGHTTYHDDVIGGTMTLDFVDDDYALEVPWRYTDTASSYDQLSTSDGKFQINLESPIRKSKVIVMQSPGLPEKVKGEVLAGPYVVTTVGSLPSTTAEVSIRTAEEALEATIMGWDGESWVEYETTTDGKTASAEGDLVSTYIVVR